MSYFGTNIRRAIGVLRGHPILLLDNGGLNLPSQCPNHTVEPTCKCGENTYCRYCGFGTGVKPCSCERASAEHTE